MGPIWDSNNWNGTPVLGTLPVPLHAFYNLPSCSTRSAPQFEPVHTLWVARLAHLNR